MSRSNHETLSSLERTANYNKFKKYITSEVDNVAEPSNGQFEVLVKEDKRVDYVLVYSKTNTVNNLYRTNAISTYINNMKQQGLTVQEQQGIVLDDLVCIKITAPNPVLTKCALEYGVELTKDNPHYKFAKKVLWKYMSSVVVQPNPDDPVYQRAKNVLSGNKPTDFTNAEKILIIDKLLSEISHGSAKDEIGCQKMISKHIILAGYPLHDSPYQWTDEGPLSDRQEFYLWCFGKEPRQL
ncbi:hypothetical protein NQ317_014379 [Molorchus minor]|uniref:Anoctamin dimerisation domain-containing protein n=1 Tax=Molorchus minor TaxID=1323400 RepID=A0ABQ9K590_9CUCU|nr:hypothetical protein NQ317_014379 [Molorchus minor]